MNAVGNHELLSVLPEQFSALEKFSSWALPLETERNAKRLASSMSEMNCFYENVVPRAEEILNYLNGFDLDALPRQEQNLLYMMLALAEVSFAVEVYKQPEVAKSVQEYGGFERFKTLHER